MVRQLQGYRTILQGPEPLAARLEALARSMLTAFNTDISSMMHDMTHIRDTGLHQIVNRAFRSELFDPLLAVMREGIAAGLLRADDPDFFTWVFLGMVNTFIRAKNSAPAVNSQTADVLARRVVEFFLVGAGNSHL